MKKNKYIGSSFESYLKSEGIFEEVNMAAVKSIIARHLKEHMKKMDLSPSQMAKQLKTTKSGLDRLLDPDNYSVTLLALNRAASIIGQKVTINLVGFKRKKGAL